MKVENDTNNTNINEGFFSKHRHTLMMAVGCMIPLLLLGILWFAGVSKNILSFGIILLLEKDSIEDRKQDEKYIMTLTLIVLGFSMGARNLLAMVFGV